MELPEAAEADTTAEVAEIEAEEARRTCTTSSPMTCPTPRLVVVYALAFTPNTTALALEIVVHGISMAA
jgi:hypothetical protein